MQGNKELKVIEEVKVMEKANVTDNANIIEKIRSDHPRSKAYDAINLTTECTLFAHSSGGNGSLDNSSFSPMDRRMLLHSAPIWVPNEQQ